MIRRLRGTIGISLCCLSHTIPLAQSLALKREVVKPTSPAPCRRLGARRDVVTLRTHVPPPRLLWRHRGLLRRLHISHLQSSRHSWVTRHVLSRLFRMPSQPAQHWTLGSTADRMRSGAPPPFCGAPCEEHLHIGGSSPQPVPFGGRPSGGRFMSYLSRRSSTSC